MCLTFEMQVSLAGALVIGLCVGSFANVVIWRWPENWSIIWPPSHCPRCFSAIVPHDNIPVLSWLMLRGRCRSCGGRISLRYPAVEVLVGLGFAAVVWRFGWTMTTLELSYFFFALVVVSFIDMDRMILPDIFTFSGMALGLIGAAINPERSFSDAVYGLALGGGVLWTVAFIYSRVRGEEGMGGGDVKLLAWIGATLGWKSVVFVLLFSSLLGSGAGLVAAIRSRQGLQTRIPFGPYLALGAVVYAFAGDWLVDGYFHFFLLRPPE
jgi:leader peptidase (prepilin peptidase)/N-methyltransferase